MSTIKITASTPATTLRWGFLGAGYICSDFGHALIATEGNTVVSVGAREQSRAAALGAKLGASAARCYGSYAEVINDAEVQVVYVGTTHPSHHQLTLDALRAGKHVLVEKPLATDPIGAREMVEEARKQGKFLMEGMWTRFFPAVRKARELMESGEIGQVYAAYADFGFRAGPPFTGRIMDPEQAGGAVLDIGVYPITAVGMPFLPTPPSEVVVTGVKEPKSGCDLATSMSMKFGEDKLAMLHFTLQTKTPEETTYVGTEGRITICTPAHCPEKIKISKQQGRDGDVETVEMDFPLPRWEAKFNYPNSEGFIYQAQAVREHILAGRLEAPEFTWAESVSCAEVCWKVRETIGVKYPFEK